MLEEGPLVDAVLRGDRARRLPHGRPSLVGYRRIADGLPDVAVAFQRAEVGDSRMAQVVNV